MAQRFGYSGYTAYEIPIVLIICIFTEYVLKRHIKMAGVISNLIRMVFFRIEPVKSSGSENKLLQVNDQSPDFP